MPLHRAVQQFIDTVWADLTIILKAVDRPPSEYSSMCDPLAEHLRHKYYMAFGSGKQAIGDHDYGEYYRGLISLALYLDEGRIGELPVEEWQGRAGVDRRCDTCFYYVSPRDNMRMGQRIYINAKPAKLIEVMGIVTGWVRARKGRANAKIVGPAETVRTDSIIVYLATDVDGSSLIAAIPPGSLESSNLTATIPTDKPGISIGPAIGESWGMTICTAIAEAIVNNVLYDALRIDQLDLAGINEEIESSRANQASYLNDPRTLQYYKGLETSALGRLGRARANISDFIDLIHTLENKQIVEQAVAEFLRKYNVDPVTLGPVGYATPLPLESPGPIAHNSEVRRKIPTPPKREAQPVHTQSPALFIMKQSAPRPMPTLEPRGPVPIETGAPGLGLLAALAPPGSHAPRTNTPTAQPLLRELQATSQKKEKKKKGLFGKLF